MRKAAFLLLVGALICWATGIAAAQATPAQPPTFEVASIKPNSSGTYSSTRAASERFTASYVTIRQIIRMAYGGLQDFQLAKGPDWITSERFDIMAKAAGEFKEGELEAMLRSLLADRFHLVVRHEGQEQEAFALTPVRLDDVPGPKLRRVPDCAGTGPSARRDCAPSTLSGSRDSLQGASLTLEALASSLSAIVRRAVVDRTGMVGRFDVDLKWSTDQDPAADQPSIFTALQEQLHLKLEPAREVVDVVIIDGIDHPTAD